MSLQSVRQSLVSSQLQDATPTTNTNTNMIYPTTLADIYNAAASMFTDPAVISVNIITHFGEVTVYRNGQIFMA